MLIICARCGRCHHIGGMEPVSAEAFVAEMPNRNNPALTDVVMVMFVETVGGELIGFEIIAVISGIRIVRDPVKPTTRLKHTFDPARIKGVPIAA